MNDKTTHFGYQEIPLEEKVRKVADVFHSVVDKYDIMNDLMSFGVHRLWKRFCIEMSGARKGSTILDVAGGTGDLAIRFSRLVGHQGIVVLSDINGSMLKAGQVRLTDLGLVGNVRYVQANAECLPFPDNHFDCISIGFGLRNVTDKPKALHTMRRILKPGGVLLVLEFSKPVVKGLGSVYDFYSFSLLPKLGRLVTGDEASYQYLAESIRKHPHQEALKTIIQHAGFEKVDYYNLSGGIVALHLGYKL